MVHSTKNKKNGVHNRNSISSSKGVKRPSISILEEHENIRISIKNINDYDATYLDNDALFSDSEGEDVFESSNSNTDLSDFLEEEEEMCQEPLSEQFKMDEMGVFKRRLSNETEIGKTLKNLMFHNRDLILSDENKHKYYKLLSKKYANLTVEEYHKMIIFQGFYPSLFASIQLEKPSPSEYKSDSLLSIFNISSKDFDMDTGNWELKAQRAFKMGSSLPLGKKFAVKSLQDISLIKMALKCENCDKNLQPKNVSLKAKTSEFSKESKLTKNVTEEFKCDLCNISFCSQKCMNDKIKLHKELCHPSLKYKPHLKIDGKKYRSLELLLLNNKLEDVFVLLELQASDVPCPKFNILNLPYQKSDSAILYSETYELFKDVFTQSSLEFDDFLKEVGKCHFLNLFKDAESDSIYPIISLLKHSCQAPNAEIHNGMLYFVDDIAKGDTIKLDFYKHCTRNISSDIGRYIFLKSNFGIHCECDECLRKNVVKDKRRKSSVRFVEKVVAINLAQ